METRYAGFWKRVAAALLDAAILGGMAFLISMAYLHSHLKIAYGMGGYMPDDPGFATSLSAFVFMPLQAAESIFVLPLLCIFYRSIIDFPQLLKDSPDLWLFVVSFPALNWVYHAIMESSIKQATVGKMMLAIKVTDQNGQRIPFWKATVRHFGKILSTLVLLVGFLMAGWTQKNQALHDKVAGCLVIRKSSG